MSEEVAEQKDESSSEESGEEEKAQVNYFHITLIKNNKIKCAIAFQIATVTRRSLRSKLLEEMTGKKVESSSEDSGEEEKVQVI
jgi:hypothetical protein